MTRALRRNVALAAVLGVAAGAVGASASREPAAAPAPPVVTAADAAPKTTASPLPHARARIDARADDPHGGAPWAMRSFVSDHRGTPLHCAQLGRMQGGRFGWIATGRRFRAARYDSLDVPTFCDSERFLARIGAQISRAALVSTARDGGAVAAATITYGHAAAAVREVALERGPVLRTGRDGAFLLVQAGQADAGAPAGELRLRDGRRRTFDRTIEPPRPPRRPGRPPPERPIGEAVLATRAPDPGGGLPWGLFVARGTRGASCFSSPGRLLRTRQGHLDARLGLFYAGFIGGPLRCADTFRRASRRRPAPLETGLYGLHDEDPAGRNQLRRVDGRTLLYGPVHPDVVALTIRTPRDVRTLVPSRAGHAVLAVYDGSFPAGPITVTSRMRDGSSVTQQVSSGGA